MPQRLDRRHVREFDDVLAGQRKRLKDDAEAIAAGEPLRSRRAQERYASLVYTLRAVCELVDGLRAEAAEWNRQEEKLRALQTAYAELAERGKNWPAERDRLVKLCQQRKLKALALGDTVRKLRDRVEVLERKLMVRGLAAGRESA